MVGIPTYGRSWTLSGSSTALLSPASGAGTAGPLSGEGGLLMYSEICKNVNQNGWTKVTDSTGKMGPYAFNGNQWVGYDDMPTVAIKAQYIVDNQLGGSMFWDLASDDFKNLCGDGKYPLFKTVSDIVKNGKTCGNVKRLKTNKLYINVKDPQVHHLHLLQLLHHPHHLHPLHLLPQPLPLHPLVKCV